MTQFEEGEEGLSVPLSVLNSAPRPISLRALRMVAPEAQAVHLEAMLDLCESKDPSARLDFPGGTVRRVYDTLLFAPISVELPAPASLCEGFQIWGKWHITCTPAI